MFPDMECVTRIIREIAGQEVMARFQHLSESDVSEKRPGDLVTTADIESEKRLEAELLKLIPESVVVGEEASETNPELYKLFEQTDPVWVIDPLDGTHNFVHGVPCFAVIVAYCVAGETLAGWIHDPVSDITAWAAKGEGAWIGHQRLRAAAPDKVENMRGSVGWKQRKRLAARQDTDAIRVHTIRYGCVGREYIDLGRGELHFAEYAKRLKPWDHAAGVLIHREAGGYSARTDSRTPYRPSEPKAPKAALLLAPDEATWETLHAVLSSS